MDDTENKMAPPLINILDIKERYYFFSNGANFSYQCLYSSGDRFQLEKEYPIYDISPLLRILMKRKNTLSGEQLAYYYKDLPYMMGHILEWSENSRKFALLNYEGENILELLAQEEGQVINSAILQDYQQYYYERKSNAPFKKV